MTQEQDYRIFDAHLHVIDPHFPLVPNRGYLPGPFTAEDYLERVASLNIAGGAVVSGSFQAFDQGYLVDALNRLGLSRRGDATARLRLGRGGIAARCGWDQGGALQPPAGCCARRGVSSSTITPSGAR